MPLSATHLEALRSPPLISVCVIYSCSQCLVLNDWTKLETFAQVNMNNEKLLVSTKTKKQFFVCHRHTQETTAQNSFTYVASELKSVF